MAYVDVVVIMGSRSQDFEEIFTSLITEKNTMGVEINEKGTIYDGAPSLTTKINE